MHKKIFKSAVAAVLSLCMLFSMTSIAFAAEGDKGMTAVSAYALENVTTNLTQDLTWVDIRNTKSPIEVHGLYNYTDRTLQDGNFVRMDPAVAAAVTNDANENFQTNGSNCWGHNQDTTGGRVRFSTNSRYVAVQALYPIIPTWGTASMAGKENAAIDIYVDTADGTTLAKTIVPVVGFSKGSTNQVLEGVIDFGTAEVRNITIYMPILTPVKEFYVGMSNDATIGQNTKRYKEGSNVVWYGSSLTEGGSVTHPGQTYAALLSQYRNEDFTNVGMWGSAAGQTQMADYFASLTDMSMFIMDYDHNESNANSLKTKHWNMYTTVRNAHPDLPIIFISRPNRGLATWADMRAAIQANYETAVENGDKNVYFIDGQTIFASAANYSDCFSSDGLHHSDYGSELFAKAVLNKIKDIEGGWNEGLALYENDFSDASTAEDFTVGNGQGFTVADGKMNFDVTGESIKYPLAQSAEWDNYSVSATVNVGSETNKNLFGIYARGGSVRMLLRHNGAAKLRLRVYTTGNTYYESGDIYDFNTDHTLKIMVKGAEIKFFINDEEVFADKDRTATAALGAVGIETFCGSSRRTVATVDDFTVKALGTAGEPKGIVVPDTILAQVGETVPVFTFQLDYGAYGKENKLSTDEGVTVTADTTVENITTYSVSYNGYTDSGTMYVLQDKSKAYADSFDSLNTAAWSVSNATVANGVMTVSNGYAKLDKLSGATEWTDYILECDVTTRGLATSTTLQQTTCAISVRNKSGNNGYEYGPIMINKDLSASGFRLYERGSATVNRTYSTHKPTPGQTDHIRIMVSGKNIKFYILRGNEYILTHEVTDAVYEKGSIRFYVNTACFATDFDNLIVIPLTDKKLQGIALPQETVYVPWGTDPDIQMTLNYGIHGTEEVSIFETEGANVFYNRYQVGEQTLTVQYQGKEVSMKVHVVEQTGIEVGNFVLQKGQAPVFDIYNVYGPVKSKFQGNEYNCVGLDVNKPGRQEVTFVSGAFTTTATVTVIEEEIYKYVDFNDIADGGNLVGWNVNTWGTVQDGVMTTNNSTVHLLNGTRHDDPDSAVSADFRLSNSQLNYYYDKTSAGRNTAFGVVRFGQSDAVNNRLALNVQFDDQCKPYLTLVASYGPDGLNYETFELARVPFNDFKLEEFFNLEMIMYGNTVAGYVNGIERIKYSFDYTDTNVADGRKYYSPAAFYSEVMQACTRHGIVANGAVMAYPTVTMPVDVDNFVERDITAYWIALQAGSEFGYADADRISVKQEAGLPGEWIAVEADVNQNGSLLVNGYRLFATNAGDFGGKGTSFGFTMPHTAVTISLSMYDQEITENTYDVATVGTSIKEGYGIRFLNRMYLPRVYDGEKVVSLDLGNIVEFGAYIIPADLWQEYDSDCLNLENFPLDIAAKAVAYSANSRCLYDITERYVDFSVVVKTSNTAREYICMPYVLTSDGYLDLTGNYLKMSMDNWCDPLDYRPEEAPMV